jgi:hypothetical protein
MTTRCAIKTNLTAAGIAAAMLIAPAGALARQQSNPRYASSISAQTTVNWQISLKPGSRFSQATGSAQYQSQPGQRELQLEIEHLHSLAGKRVIISVNGAVTGSTKVSTRGIAQFDRNTELGQKVLSIVHRSTVSVQTTTGTLVASGRF